MAIKIVWSQGAINDRRDIFNYWNNRNKSTNYSLKLRALFNEAIKTIQLFPEIGKATSKTGVRLKIVRDFFIIYHYANDTIRIVSIWDSRQDPVKLEKLIN